MNASPQADAGRGDSGGLDHGAFLPVWTMPFLLAFADLIEKRRQPRSLREALREVAQRHHVAVGR